MVMTSCPILASLSVSMAGQRSRSYPRIPMVCLDAAQKITVSNKSLFALPIIALVGVACTLAGYLLVKTFGFSIFPPCTHSVPKHQQQNKAYPKMDFFLSSGGDLSVPFMFSLALWFSILHGLDVGSQISSNLSFASASAILSTL